MSEGLGENSGNRALFSVLNDQIPIKWLDGGYETSKVKCNIRFKNPKIQKSKNPKI